MKNVEKTNNPKFDQFMIKVDVQRFGFNNFLQDFI